jgi:hypothetical protein
MQNVPFSYMPERKRDIYSYLQYDLTTNLAWYPWKAMGRITHVNKTVCDTEKQLSIFIRYWYWTSIIMILQYVSSIQDFWGVLQHALFISTWLFDEICIWFSYIYLLMFKTEITLFQLLNHQEDNLKVHLLIKSGRYSVPNPSTTLA